MIVAALLLRNEAGPDRYLRRVLDNVKTLCDDIVVVDDHSEDDTTRICREYGATVSQLTDNSAWWGTDETSARAHLWTLAAKVAGPDGWVYCADGDHILEGVTREDMHTLAAAEHVNGWAWPLMDMWSEDHFRIDGYWQAWRSPRVWMVKVPPAGWQPAWTTRDIHAGHFPHNLEIHAAVAPGFIRHMGYARPEHREAKARKYLALAK